MPEPQQYLPEIKHTAMENVFHFVIVGYIESIKWSLITFLIPFVSQVTQRMFWYEKRGLILQHVMPINGKIEIS